MIHSHVRNVNYVYDTLDYNIPCIEPHINVKQNLTSNTDQQEESLKHQSNLKFKWIHTPHLLYENNAYQVSSSSCQKGFFKSTDDKYFQLPIDKINNYNEWNITNMSHILHQNSVCLKKKLCKTEVISNKEDISEVSNVEVISNGTSLSNYCESLDNENQDLKKCMHNVNENNMFNMEKQKRFEQELKIEQQAIQQDIYKMDVVCYNEEIDTIMDNQISQDDSIVDNLIVHRKLKRSLQNFLKRAEQDISIELPRLPQIKSLNIFPLKSKHWEFITQKNLENKKRLELSINTKNNSKEKHTSGSIKKISEKKESVSLNVYPKSPQLQVLQENFNIALNKTQTLECENKDNIENLLYKSATKQIEQNNVNLFQQTASVTDLATFKKHYYDTLLNIQKAKVAVANSLAISSVESSTKYDPYYSSCSYQHQQLLQQHGQLSVNPQFAMHTITRSKLSNVHNTPYTWVRCNNWKHPTARQLRFPQQSPFQHSRNKEFDRPTSAKEEIIK
ncbi:uncharacterized protein LOC143185581 isoform X2 [Calliopsis andreniformis]|uniref:uncharacterized protein LOC143185581 isoform X2 n=1 Tax=Calliopsis andreniformis TaxID=337506 RepID=UPI003FCEDC96